MTKAHAQEQIEKGLDYFVCTQHKTCKTYGDLAKWVAPGTIKALECYMGLPGKTSNLLFDPVGMGTQAISISFCLNRFAAFFPTFEPMNSNLIRKQFHTTLIKQSREGKCLDLLSKVDAHSTSVAKAIYCTTTPAKHAKLGKYFFFEEVYGKPVHWPMQQKRHCFVSTCIGCNVGRGNIGSGSARCMH
jgi:hypothetical protein